MKPTYRPSRIKRARKFGFRARMATKAGRAIIRARRRKGHSGLLPRQMRLQSRQRLRKQSDFLQVREQGNTFRCPHFFLQILIDPKRQKCLRRIGIITSRRVGIAVKRNKGRRILREIFRRNQKTLPESCDLVVVMRNTFNQASFTEMEKLF